MKAKAIKIDRRWIGAPERAWNPTTSLFALAVGGFGVGAAAMLAGVLPAVPGVLWLAVCMYLSFTVLHDAMHGTAHRSKAVGNAMGRICGLLLMAPLPLFRGVHHAHHGHTNDPDRDPDLVVAAGPAWLRPLALASTLFAYRWHFYRQRLWRDPASLREAVAMDVALFGFLVWAFVWGPAAWVLLLWIAPLMLAAFWLAFAFDYLPHYPHSQQGRYYDTRVYPGRLANLLFLGQNYHLIHHLWTTIPWYRYQAVFESIEPELRERECAIGWRSRAVAPAGSAERVDPPARILEASTPTAAAVVAPRSPGRDLEPELLAYGKDRLAGYKRPRLIAQVDRIPRAPNGKPDYEWAKKVATERAGRSL
jgi:fatty acid desaturase